jgi:glycosyltransferase involved in cell wall biosynthesis
MISSSVETNQNNPPFLCTFVPGGASVMNKQTFYECGGYDSGMFVGFEDVEFSLRLYQKGLKVGACGMASIIHDHPEPEKISDADYERIRFSGQRIGNSGRYFEKKHGFSVWNPETEKWVGDRLKQLLSDTQSDTVYIEKSSIALIIDAKNWALDHIADQITDKLKNKYHFKKIYLSEFDNLTDIFLLASQCQLIHFMWSPLLSTYYNHSTQSKIPGLGMTEDDFYQKFIKNKKISVAIYDHLLLDGKNREITQALFSDPKSLVDFYTVSTKKLKRVYDEDPNIKMKPTAVIPDGVDLEIFKPKNLKRFENITNRAIKVGWVGNSKWEVSDLKGINTIIKPAINILKSKGYNLELITSDRQIKGIPFEEMQDFYSNIDIYVCASLHEGTPNPVLEAMACGIPVVSTNVGLVPELFGQRQTDFILEERSVKCLVSTLEVLLNNPEYFKLLSDENLTSIMVWDWKIVVNNFDEYFDKCINL